LHVSLVTWFETRSVTEVIHFDARFIRPGNPDGISRFSLGLLAELAQLERVVALVSSDEQIAVLPKSVDHLRVNNPTSVREMTLGFRLNRAGVKLLFSPMQTTGSLGRKFKLVLTLHDLIYYRHPTPPGFLPPLVRLGWRLFHLSFWPQRWLLNRADHVVTVSETSANQIVAARLTKRPVSVVNNATDQERGQPRGHPGSKSLVYMGSFMPYKNVETLIAALNQLPDYTLELLSAIEPARKTELTALAERKEQLIFHGGVAEGEYLAILGRAQALVSASLDEGFGIPVLEAMRAGTPVICSDIEIFREVAAGAAAHFEPRTAASLVSVIRELEDPKHWQRLSSLGLERAQHFSWENSAAKLRALLRSL
jgi:glycosyltransferase involved in cell wall biosynthesis